MTSDWTAEKHETRDPRGKHARFPYDESSDAVRQVFTGSGDIQQMVQDEIDEFVKRFRGVSPVEAELILRARFNPNLDESWLGSVIEIANNLTTHSIILTGEALIREREHGTIEHLLVKPVTPTEVMFAKIWSMVLVVLLATAVALVVIV